METNIQSFNKISKNYQKILKNTSHLVIVEYLSVEDFVLIKNLEYNNDTNIQRFWCFSENLKFNVGKIVNSFIIMVEFEN